MLTHKFQHVKMVNKEDMYQHLIMMTNLADELEEVTMPNVMNKDFMMALCFPIMEILRYKNIIEIMMNSRVLKRADFINKLIVIEQQYKAANKRPPKFHTTLQALNKRKRKRKKGVYFNCGKEGHFAK